MSVKNCYVEERIAESGGGSNDALTLQVDTNTADIVDLQTEVAENTTLIETNAIQIEENTAALSTFGITYFKPISEWLTTAENLPVTTSGKWVTAFDQIDLKMKIPFMYKISVNFVALTLTQPNDVKSVGIQLFQWKNGLETSIATSFTAASVISTAPIEPSDMYAIPCNISFTLEIAEPELLMTMKIYFSSVTEFDYQITPNIPSSTLDTSYWTSTMNVSPDGFTASMQ